MFLLPQQSWLKYKIQHQAFGVFMSDIICNFLSKRVCATWETRGEMRPSSRLRIQSSRCKVIRLETFLGTCMFIPAAVTRNEVSWIHATSLSCEAGKNKQLHTRLERGRMRGIQLHKNGYEHGYECTQVVLDTLTHNDDINGIHTQTTPHPHPHPHPK